LEAKAAGYKRLMAVCEDRKDLAPALLVIEQLPQLVSEQVKPIQNLQIDKITVWDSGNGDGDSSTAGLLKGMIGALPPVHELARQAGIDLPSILGRVVEIERDAAAESSADSNPPADDAQDQPPA
jgi:flotillin